MSYYRYGLDDRMVGKTVADVSLLDNGETLKITFADGEWQEYEASGDCCSHSWIEHLTVPPDIAGATITGLGQSGSVEATEGQREEARTRNGYVDSLAVYHESIETDRGEIIIEHRNDSNGYYGGILMLRGQSSGLAD